MFEQSLGWRMVGACRWDAWSLALKVDKWGGSVAADGSARAAAPAHATASWFLSPPQWSLGNDLQMCVLMNIPPELKCSGVSFAPACRQRFAARRLGRAKPLPTICSPVLW